VSDSEVLFVWNGQRHLAEGLSKRGVIASGSSVNYESPGSDEQAGSALSFRQFQTLCRGMQTMDWQMVPRA
jgi:hypothetical protein